MAREVEVKAQTVGDLASADKARDSASADRARDSASVDRARLGSPATLAPRTRATLVLVIDTAGRGWAGRVLNTCGLLGWGAYAVTSSIVLN